MHTGEKTSLIRKETDLDAENVSAEEALKDSTPSF